MVLHAQLQRYRAAFQLEIGLDLLDFKASYLLLELPSGPLVNKLAAALLAHPATPPDLSLLSAATYAMEQDSISAIIQFHSRNPLQFEANSSSDSSQGILKKGISY